MNTHTDPTTDLERLRERCGWCDAPMNVVIRGHHHTENGRDVTRTPRWLQWTQANQNVKELDR
jgi:hypothetical protein